MSRTAGSVHRSKAAVRVVFHGLWLGALLCCVLSGRDALARDSDLDQPIDINADRSEYDERAGKQVLEGNVRITQGTLVITADRIEVLLEDGRLSRIEGTGQPLGFEQDNEDGERMRGAARRISYDAIGGSLVLEGEATLEQPRQSLVSDRIVFDTSTQTVRAEGDSSQGESGRVSIRIEPPQRNSGDR